MPRKGVIGAAVRSGANFSSGSELGGSRFRLLG